MLVETNRAREAARGRLPNGRFRTRFAAARRGVFALGGGAVVAVVGAALAPARGAHDGEVSPWASVRC